MRGGGSQRLPFCAGEARGDLASPVLERFLLVASSSCRSSSRTIWMSLSSWAVSSLFSSPELLSGVRSSVQGSAEDRHIGHLSVCYHSSSNTT